MAKPVRVTLQLLIESLTVYQHVHFSGEQGRCIYHKHLLPQVESLHFTLNVCVCLYIASVFCMCDRTRNVNFKWD